MLVTHNSTENNSVGFSINDCLIFCSSQSPSEGMCFKRNGTSVGFCINTAPQIVVTHNLTKNNSVGFAIK